MMYRQRFPALALSLERGTEDVPDDGRYHLVVHGEVVESFPRERPATTAYEEMRRRLIAETGWTPELAPPSRDEVLARLRAESDVKAVQADSSRSKRAKAVRKGGKGGTGGV